MELVKASFVVNPGQYENCCCHTHRKSGDINESETLSLQKISERDNEIVFDHDVALAKVRPRFKRHYETK
jgi:hypothetical protein